MKTIIQFLFMFCSLMSFAQVGVGTTTPDPSSVLDVVSSNSGILIPRLLVSERINITNPAEGLLVYQTDDITGFYYFNTTQWVRLADNPRDAVPTGAVFAFPTASAPNGYLECDGSAVSRSTYASLFALIGINYGNGDGTTTFNLPDYRGEFLRGFNNGSGNDPNAVSRLDRGDGTTGDNVGTRQTNLTQSHVHGIDPPAINSTNGGYHGHTIQPRTFNTNSNGNHSHSIGSFTLNTSTAGNHNHPRFYANRSVGSVGSTTVREVGTGSGTGAPTGYAGNHNHQVNFPTRTTTSSGNHTHSVYVNNLTMNSSGNHQHNINIPSFSSSSHGGSETRPTNVSVMWTIKY